MDIEQYIIEIKNKLKRQGYAGKKITYSEFEALYQAYGDSMTDKVFAQNVLEMTIDQYDSLKKGKYKATVLKNQLEEIIQQDVETIKNILALEGYCGKLIDYAELQRLHKSYGSQMPENKFAQLVLDLSDKPYQQVKSGKRKVFILKSLQNKALQNIEEIKEELQKQGYAGKTIEYTELQNLHQMYGKMLTETQFAQKILELSSSTYIDIKNYGKKAKVLKKFINKEAQENIERIKEQLKKDGYVGKTIDYAEFQRLHQMYGSNMPEYQFAQDVLEIGYSTYKTTLKNRQKRATILKSLVQLGVEIEEIKEILKSLGYVGKLINYSELQRLHQQYASNMQENKFAKEVLEISAGLYRNIKNNERKRATILKSLINQVSQEEIERIQDIIEARGIAGKLINYGEFQRIHKEYGSHIREETFAQQVLEIPSRSYREIRDGECETQILCRNKKVELIQTMLLKESRWYTREELQQICVQNRISIDKIIRQVISNGTNIYNEDYKKVLEEKGKLWIGKTNISEQFLEENMEDIMRIARTVLYSLKKRYGISQNSEDEDFIQDAIIWIAENGGEIEKNFTDYPDIMKQKIFNTIKKGITIKILMLFDTNMKTVSLNKKLKIGKGQERELQNRIAVMYDLEEDVISQIDSDESGVVTANIELESELAAQCIQEMKQQIEAGECKTNILKSAEEKFGLSKKELLEIMQYYLVTKGSLKTVKGNTGVSSQEQR